MIYLNSSLLSLVFLISFPASATSGWLCEEAASIREGSSMTLCGIGEEADEDKARKLALQNAFAELDLICGRSADCRDFELNIEPMRNECSKFGEKFKCYRAVRAEITTQKREKPPTAEQRQVELTTKEAEQEVQVTRYQCGHDTESALNLFNDLSTPSKIENAVKMAMKIPMRLACVKFHFQIFNQLTRAKVVSAKYNDFLLTTIRAGTTADDTHVALEIAGYFYEQGPYDAKKWTVVRSLFERLPEGLMYRLAPELFHTSLTGDARQTQLQRLDELMSEAKKNKVGRPVPLPFTEIYLHVARGVTDHPNDKHPDFALAFFSKYFDQAKAASPDGLVSPLLRLYSSLKDSKHQAQVATWLGRSFVNASIDQIKVQDLHRFPEVIERDLKNLDPESVKGENQIKAHKAHLNNYLQLTSAVMDTVFGNLENKWEIQKAIDFCLEHSLPCKKVVPDEESLRKMLTSKFDDKKILALKILSKKTKSSKTLENEIYRTLIFETEKDGSQNHEIIRSAIRSLINHGVSDPVKVRKILQVSLNRQFPYDDVIQTLGATITPYVIEIAADERHPSQFTGVRMLKTLSKSDPKAQEALKKFAADTQKPELQRQALDALGAQ